MPHPIAYLGRHPKPKDLIGKLLFGSGGLLRALGQALDGVGAAAQGPYGLKQELPPNAAWLSLPAAPGAPGAPPAPASSSISQRAVQSSSSPSSSSSSSAAAAAAAASSSSAAQAGPSKGDGVFVAPSATVVGRVSLGEGSSVWYGATLRGDINRIEVGRRTNIQDNAVVHVAKHSPSAGGVSRATVIGDDCTVGHGALLHGCTVGDGCLVGMGATLLDGVVMEPGSVVGAGAVVPPGSVVKTGQIWAGSPARLLRTVSPEEAAFLVQSAANYAALAREHARENGKAFEEVALDAAAAGERRWREGTDIDVHQGIYRDPQTQAILSMR